MSAHNCSLDSLKPISWHAFDGRSFEGNTSNKLRAFCFCHTVRFKNYFKAKKYLPVPFSSVAILRRMSQNAAHCGELSR